MLRAEAAAPTLSVAMTSTWSRSLSAPSCAARQELLVEGAGNALVKRQRGPTVHRGLLLGAPTAPRLRQRHHQEVRVRAAGALAGYSLHRIFIL